MLDSRLGDFEMASLKYIHLYISLLFLAVRLVVDSCLFYRWWWWVQRGLWHGQHEQWWHIRVWADRCHRTHGHGRRRTLLQLHTRQAQQVRVRTGQVVCDLLGNTDCPNIQSLFKKFHRNLLFLYQNKFFSLKPLLIVLMLLLVVYVSHAGSCSMMLRWSSSTLQASRRNASEERWLYVEHAAVTSSPW